MGDLHLTWEAWAKAAYHDVVGNSSNCHNGGGDVCMQAHLQSCHTKSRVIVAASIYSETTCVAALTQMLHWCTDNYSARRQGLHNPLECDDKAQSAEVAAYSHVHGRAWAS